MAIDAEVRLVEMKTALAVHEERQIAGLDFVLSLPGRVEVSQRVIHRSTPIQGGSYGVGQAVPGRILVVVQVAFRAFALGSRIQRVDEHRGDRRGAGYFDSWLAEFGGNFRHVPLGIVRRTRIRMPRHAAAPQRGVNRLKPGLARIADAFCESSVQVGNQRQQVFRKSLLSAIHRGVFDTVGTGHSEFAI